MKSLILMSLIALASCYPANDVQNLTSDLPTYFLVEDAPDIYHKEPLIGKPQAIADDSAVKMYFYSRNMTNGIEVDCLDANSIKKTDFSSSRETVVISHGWQNSYSSDINVQVRSAYLSARDINVFVVDWSEIAKLDYVTAQHNIENVGNTVGSLIKGLVSNGGLNLGSVVLVGHSLGAHVVGVAGRAIGGEANHAVGLDPAGPLFSVSDTSNRITPDSAKFVQIIHTCAGLLGFDHQLGHADYWPNGGKKQAGCGVDETGSCAHSRSYQYFSESLNSSKFVARSCSDWNTYENGECKNNNASSMGQDNVDKSASGNYFLETNDNSPFAKG